MAAVEQPAVHFTDEQLLEILNHHVNQFTQFQVWLWQLRAGLAQSLPPFGQVFGIQVPNFSGPVPVALPWSSLPTSSAFVQIADAGASAAPKDAPTSVVLDKAAADALVQLSGDAPVQKNQKAEGPQKRKQDKQRSRICKATHVSADVESQDQPSFCAEAAGASRAPKRRREAEDLPAVTSRFGRPLKRVRRLSASPASPEETAKEHLDVLMSMFVVANIQITKSPSDTIRAVDFNKALRDVHESACDDMGLIRVGQTPSFIALLEKVGISRVLRRDGAVLTGVKFK